MHAPGRKRTWLLCAFASLGTAFAESPATFQDVHGLIERYCYGCHRGTSAAGKLDLSRYPTQAAVEQARATWGRVAARIRAGEMPPRGLPAPSIEERAGIVDWTERTLRAAACIGDPKPSPAPLRRLNREEYSATLRDLLRIQVNAGSDLPADGAGGEGFDNAAETLFLSPIHAEKYLDAAKRALDYASKDPAGRRMLFTAEPGPDKSPEEAARAILTNFLPRAFRRPVRPNELERYLAIFQAAQKRQESFEESILYTLQAVLVSPNFLFLVEEPNPGTAARPLDDYELASRLSYFLWGSTPDQVLYDLAAEHKLNDPAVLKQQVARMMSRGAGQVDGDRVRIAGGIKVHDFAERFVAQWLGTRELGREIKPDPKLFPRYYDAELQAAIRDEPVMFFQEILSTNLSLLNLLDSNFIFVNDSLQRLYGLQLGRINKQLVKKDLPPDSHRGGLLGMAAVAAVSSYPSRTSPVLRGKWVLDAILGTPPPPPPPNVPALGENHDGTPASLRERLMLHRQDPACSSCHASIDPIGFGLENYDVLGRWRTEDGGKPIDTKGELPDGTAFDGPAELKAILLKRKDIFIRHLTNKMMGYALGRSLTVEDSCTVDQIVANLAQNEYKAQILVEGIVLSAPFRFQAGGASGSRKEAGK